MSVPWKEDRPSLPDNRRLAEQHLESTEQKLVKDEAVATEYRVIDDYLEKGMCVKYLQMNRNQTPNGND